MRQVTLDFGLDAKEAKVIAKRLESAKLKLESGKERGAVAYTADLMHEIAEKLKDE